MFAKLSPHFLHNIVIRYYQPMALMAICDLLHKFQKQITNVSLADICKPPFGNVCVSTNFNEHVTCFQAFCFVAKSYVTNHIRDVPMS